MLRMLQLLVLACSLCGVYTIIPERFQHGYVHKSFTDNQRFEVGLEWWLDLWLQLCPELYVWIILLFSCSSCGRSGFQEHKSDLVSHLIKTSFFTRLPSSVNLICFVHWPLYSIPSFWGTITFGLDTSRTPPKTGSTNWLTTTTQLQVRTVLFKTLNTAYNL